MQKPSAELPVSNAHQIRFQRVDLRLALRMDGVDAGEGGTFWMTSTSLKCAALI
jgi:hypothetical protein